jgi:streptogramin lyase
VSHSMLMGLLRLLPVPAIAAVAVAGPAAGTHSRAPAASSFTVQARIPLHAEPYGIAAGANSIWQVTNKSTLLRLDPRTNRIVARIKFGAPITGLVFDHQDWVTVGDGFVWVADEANRQLVRIDPGTNRVVGRTSIDSPWDVATGFGSVWVPQFEPYKVARIDEKTGRVAATIPATGPSSVAVGDGSVWVLSHRANMVLRIDPTTNQPIAKIPLLYPIGPERIAFGEGAVWVTDAGEDGLDRIDPATNRTTVFINLPDSEKAPNPYFIATGGGAVWIASMAKVLRIDPHTNRVTGSFHVDHGGACGTGVMPNPGCFTDLVYAGGSLWVGDYITKTLLRLRPTT